MSAIGSGAPRPNTSRPSCGRPVSWSAALRIASRGRSRSASAGAMSSGLGPISPSATGLSRRDLVEANPRRNHQRAARELETNLARLLDEGEVLVGERQDRDLRQVHLLLARERQQQIERTLEARNVDDQRLLVGGEIGRQCGFEIISHYALAIMPANSSRAALTSIGAGLRRAFSAASARRAASPLSGGTAPATARISSSVPLQWRTTSHPAASEARLRSASVPDRAFIEMSSVISSPSKPRALRITSRTIVPEVVAGASA